MLIDFTVENYRSIGAPVTLSMERIKKLREKELDSKNLIQPENESGPELLKTAVIYGANACGKSNILRALGFMKELVQESAKNSQKGDPINFSPFAFDPTLKVAPGSFEIQFILDGSHYRYGFEVDAKNIHAEWLFREGKELFTRELQQISCSEDFEEGIGFEKNTRDNALFLSVCAQLNGKYSVHIIDDFFQKLQVMSNRGISASSFTAKLLEQDAIKPYVLKILREADIGISDVQQATTPMEDVLETMPAKMRSVLLESIKEQEAPIEELMLREINVLHGSPDNILPLEEESDGTQKLFHLIGPVLDSIRSGNILIIDEFNDKLHPILARKIVKMFNSSQNNSAQLIAATHDTNLLDKSLFRRDQIWFIEKNRDHQTDLYSLAEYRTKDGSPVRQDEKYSKKYLEGRYGAIPYLGSFPFEESE